MNLQSTSAAEDEPVVQTTAEPLQKLLKEAARNKAQTESAHAPQTLPYRATNRQPLASLTILDDGCRNEGETIRIRTKSLTIGRDNGDLTLPFDNDMSGKHAELRCQFQNGNYRWYLIDLESTNGTFLRAYRATLANDREILLGSRWYLFQLAKRLDDSLDTNEPDAAKTNRYAAPTKTLREQSISRLSEMGLPEGNSRSFPLIGGKQILGRDQSCEISIPDDPYLCPKHARISTDKQGRWVIEDLKSLNGIWIRVQRFPLDQQAEFQLGQQRFRFRPRVS